jgi:hypothetical protein
MILAASNGLRLRGKKLNNDTASYKADALQTVQATK